MPRVSEFYGIVIAMFWDDHPPPHFHAIYAGRKVKVSILDGRVIAGTMAPRELRRIERWRGLHVDELMGNWQKAQKRELLDRIEPLP
jgi:hypothetical protein